MTRIETLPFDPGQVVADFPILNQRVHNDKPLIYFDNAATTQHPQAVLDCITDCYRRTYANVHRGTHYLSEQSSRQFEIAREKVAQFIGAGHPYEVIFTSGTTAAINLVAHSWGDQNVAAGDEILLTMMEHHSNIVPWQQLASRKGAVIRWVGLSPNGELDWDDLLRQLNSRTKLMAVTAVSNVLGTINPIQSICRLAHDRGIRVFVDAAQHVPHAETDVTVWGADWVAFSGHKMLGPSGVGILYGLRALLEEMPPFLGGGSMISRVTRDGFEPGELPAKFEAGTPPIVSAIGLGTAIDYLTQFDLDQLLQHEQKLAAVAMEELQAIPGLRLLGPDADCRAGIVSFTVDHFSTQDLAILLDQQGVALRAGHHCTMPLHDYLGIKNSCRASFYMYNTLDEVQYFVVALRKVMGKLR